MEKESESQKWIFPFNMGYDSYVSIVKTLYQQKADATPVSMDRLESLTGTIRKTLNPNLTFLKSIGIIEEVNKNEYKLINPLGVEYAKGIFKNDQDLVKTKSVEFINNSHLKLLMDYVELKGTSLALSGLYEFIRGESRVTAGNGISGMSAPYASGAKTLLRIFKESGVLPANFEIDAKPSDTSTKQNTIKKKSIPDKPKKKRQKEEEDVLDESDIKEDILGKLIIQGVGIIEIRDEDTMSLAESALNLLKKKIQQ